MRSLSDAVPDPEDLQTPPDSRARLDARRAGVTRRRAIVAAMRSARGGHGAR